MEENRKVLSFPSQKSASGVGCFALSLKVRQCTPLPTVTRDQTAGARDTNCHYRPGFRRWWFSTVTRGQVVDMVLH